MHTPEIRQKYGERRARGWGFVRMDSERGVANSTLIEWSRQLRFELPIFALGGGFDFRPPNGPEIVPVLDRFLKR